MVVNRRLLLCVACLLCLSERCIGFSGSVFGVRGGLDRTLERQRDVGVCVAAEEQQMSEVGAEERSESVRKEYAALGSGQVVSVMMGDPGLSRKVWKKRRRSDSPVLVPCSIVGVSSEWMVRWNVMYLVHKYGSKAGSGEGVELAMKKMCRLYERDLEGSLAQHALSAGFSAVGDYLLQLLNSDSVRVEYGVGIRTGLKKGLLITSNAPYRLARQMAANTALLQFAPSLKNEGEMLHTGHVKVKLLDEPQPKPKPTFAAEPLSAAIRISQADIHSNRIHANLKTNAFVLSYSPQGDNSNPLLVLTIDPTRSHVRTSMKRRARAKRLQQYHDNQTHLQKLTAKKIDWNLHKDLKVGDGPLKATVVKLSDKSRAVFVDCGVGKLVKSNDSNMVKVLGMLRLDDLLKQAMGQEVEMDMQMDMDMDISKHDQQEEDVIKNAFQQWDEDDEDYDDDDDDDVLTIHDLFVDETTDDDEIEDEDEEEIFEDITDLFDVGQDGTLSSIDPNTGEKTLLVSSDEEADDDDNSDDDQEDAFSGMTPQERLNAIGRMLDNEHEALQREETQEKQQQQSHQTQTHSQFSLPQSYSSSSSSPLFLSVGDEIDVYIKAIYPQSGRFMVTVDSSIKGRKAKEMKKEREVEKRMMKLAGEDGEGLGKILDCVGLQCDGVIRAKSKSDQDKRWYVQPLLPKNKGGPLPVGVAVLPDDHHEKNLGGALETGDEVTVKIEGIDEGRGQLAMTILGRKHSS